MGGSPKRGGSTGGTVLSRGRVFLVAVLLLQLVLVVWLMTARSGDSVDTDSALEGDSAVSQGSWLWRKFVISTTPPNCTDARGTVVTEATKGSDITCSDRSSLLRLKWRDPKQNAPKSLPAENAPTNPATARARARTAAAGRNATTRLGTGITNRSESVGHGGAPGDRRVQVGRDLPATASSEEARETKSSSSRSGRGESADEVRSSLRRDSLRFRGRSGRSGDRRASNATLTAHVGGNVSDSVAPVARIGRNVTVGATNVSGSIVEAQIGAGPTASIARVARIRSPVLADDDDDEDDDESEEEVQKENAEEELQKEEVQKEEVQKENAEEELQKEEVQKEEVQKENAEEELQKEEVQKEEVQKENAEEELQKEEVQKEEVQKENAEEELQKEEEEDPDVAIARPAVSLGGRRGPLPGFNVSRSNSSFETSTTRNSSLEVIPTTRNASLEAIPTPKNSSLEAIPTARNASLEAIPTPKNASLEAIPTARDVSLEQTQPPLTRNSSSSKNLQQASPESATSDDNATIAGSNGTCAQGLIYVYTLPKKFNSALLEDCSQLLHWGDRCRELSNGGLGPFLGELGPRGHSQKQENRTDSEAATAATTGPWYGTDQFNGEVIFHRRILAHPCRTHNPELAKAFYIPYYGGLDVARFLFNVTERRFTAAETDRLGRKLSQWLGRSPYWRRRHGADHFLFLGRITWDFRRNGSRGWGSSLINMAQMANVTKLVLERSPWDANEVAIPYPTAFHPTNGSEVAAWQAAVLATRRDVLFSFAGGRRAEFPNDFRGALFAQCENSSRCEVLDCSSRTCEDDPLAATQLFMRSTFCLQPRGDSFTRRSIFDALVAGCIPVFFWRKSAHLQYTRYFPDPESFSVFIAKRDVRNGAQIEEVLRAIPPAHVQRMQRTVADMIPTLVYAANPAGLGAFRDAVDVAVDSVMARFSEAHRNLTASSNPNPNSSPGSYPTSRPRPALGAAPVVVPGPRPAASAKREVASRA